MFERSLLETQPTHRWTALASLTVQCSLAAAVLAVPLLHPASLAFRSDAPKLFLPVKPAPVLPRRVATATAATSAPAMASSPAPAGRLLVLTRLPLHAGDDALPDLTPFGGMGSGDPASIGAGDAIGTGSSRTGPSVAVVPARPARPLTVSSGVIAGLLLAPIKPVYSRMAIASRTEGTVVVEAIISKSGKIESAHVTSGPAMLREAAIDAIRNARYSPYLLNGTPTEVETTITVQFRLGS